MESTFYKQCNQHKNVIINKYRSEWIDVLNKLRREFIDNDMQNIKEKVAETMLENRQKLIHLIHGHGLIKTWIPSNVVWAFLNEKTSAKSSLFPETPVREISLLEQLQNVLGPEFTIVNDFCIELHWK